MRIEKDFLGEIELPKDKYYGIHSFRAKQNFPSNDTFSIHWYKALGIVKYACYETIIKFKTATQVHYPDKIAQLKLPNDNVLKAMMETALAINKGDYFEHFIVPATQGGAGTSINLNINEIIANASLAKLGKSPGEYQSIDPIEDCNLYQSTNDIVPTALKVACLLKLNTLEEGINQARGSMEKLENKHRNHLRLAYTQMQQAVPSTFGQLFGAYNDALGRDWWRVSKCFERIKTVNLGGGAIGSGIAIPRFYIMEVVQELKRLTGLPISQGENLTETTSNQDSWVEVHAILKACATNLEKIASDIRLLASDFSGNPDIKLPARQVGSSIMPGKVNPVIPEFLISSAHKIYSNDLLVSSLAGQGVLELNAYLPQIGEAVLESLELLIGCYRSLKDNILEDLDINTETAQQKLFKSPAICTAISPIIGYNKASELAKYMKDNNTAIQRANEKLGIIDNETLTKYLCPGFLNQKGFTLKDI
jgi:aspartate ammonia-lyase